MREFINRHTTLQRVGSDGTGEDARLDAEALPLELQRLVDLKREVDHEWDLRHWLAERAAEELTVAELELETERLRLEQRLRRMRRLREGPGDVVHADQVFSGLTHRLRRSPGQRSIFEDFGGDSAGVETEWEIRSPGQPPPVWPEDQELEEQGGIGAWVEMFAEAPNDDPLLAMTAQFILFDLATAARGRSLPVSLERILERLAGRGITEDEAFEALEWLVECELVADLEDGFAPADEGP